MCATGTYNVVNFLCCTFRSFLAPLPKDVEVRILFRIFMLSGVSTDREKSSRDATVHAPPECSTLSRYLYQGYLVLISTRMSEIGEEQFCSRFFKGGMTDVSYSPELRQAVAAGPTSIKVSARTFPSTMNVVRWARRCSLARRLTTQTCSSECEANTHEQRCILRTAAGSIWQELVESVAPGG